jgi:hypothetical protein
MTQLDLKIKIYLQNNSKNYDDERSNFSLRDDGSGAYIEVWNVSGVSKPTDEQLNALESEAIKLENNNKIRATRKSLYGDIGDQLDEIFKDIDTWKARIKKIKDDNPKESS